MLTNDEIKRVAEECGALICKFDHSIEFEQEQLLAFAQHFYKKGQDEQREKDAQICESEYKTMLDTQEAHYRYSPEIFNPKNFGFDMHTLKKLKDKADAIRNAYPESDIDKATRTT